MADFFDKASFFANYFSENVLTLMTLFLVAITIFSGHHWYSSDDRKTAKVSGYVCLIFLIVLIIKLIAGYYQMVSNQESTLP